MSSSSAKYAEVAPAIPLPQDSRQSFTYRLPKSGPAPDLFSSVTVPFGRRRIPGIILELHDRPTTYQTKSLSARSGSTLTPQQVHFARWISRTMQGGFGYTLRLFQPPAATPDDVTPSSEPELDDLIDDRPPDPLAQRLLKATKTQPAALINRHATDRHLVLQELIIILTESGGQVLILSPEKNLAHRVSRNISHPSTTVGLYHSDLSPKQQATVWHQVKNNTLGVISGTQKALFLPWTNLALIVIEEEWYTTHKLWDQYPRLDNRYAARQLATIHDARLLYSSATPSLFLLDQKAQSHLTLINHRPLKPHTTVMSVPFPAQRNAPAKVEPDRPTTSPIPPELATSLRRWLTTGQSVLFLHNQRGSWQYAHCSNCHYTPRCPTCQLAFTVIEQSPTPQLRCRQCDRQKKMPRRCPHCSPGKLATHGLGTDTLSQHLTTLTRQSPLRVDAGRLRQNTPALLTSLSSTPLVVATSAIFTLLNEPHAPRFDRIIWLHPERELLYPDFRSVERAHTILGRLTQHLSSPRRHVILLTRQPNLVRRDLADDPATIHQRTLAERRQLHYPPATDLVRLTQAGKTADQALHNTQLLADQLTERLKQLPPADRRHVRQRGPFQSFRPVRRGRHEAHLILTGPLALMTSLYDGLPATTVDLAPHRIL